MNLGKQLQCQWNSVDHREGTALPCGSRIKRDKEYPRSMEQNKLRTRVREVDSNVRGGDRGQGQADIARLEQHSGI